MFEATKLARQAQSSAAVYEIFLAMVEQVDLTLPAGVTVVRADERSCGCRLDGCFFCDALDFEVWELARAEEEAEYRDRYGRWDIDERWD